jgi:exodeoxyribonuclease V alpha subunit
VTTSPTSHRPPLVPTGTARERFLGAAAAAATEGDQPLDRDLRELLLAHDVAEETLLAAWEVTRWTAGAPIAERRALACLVVALCDAMDAGSTLLPIGGEGSPGATNHVSSDRLSRVLGRLGLGDADRQATSTLGARLLDGTAAPQIAALFGPPGARRPFILSDGALYSERLWSLESSLVSMLRQRLARTLEPIAREPIARQAIGREQIIRPAIPLAAAGGSLSASIDEAIAAAAATKGSTPLSDEQLLAVRASLTNPLTVIAGGPGAGKTSIIVALLRVLARLGVSADGIALAAPTGRAAQRITESVTAALARLEHPAPADVDLAARFTGAATLHRLLGIGSPRIRGLGPDAPQFHSGWRLPHRFVVVDEASMIDLTLMEQLASAVNDEARLILIGDADQLPSVALGAVFRDLCTGAVEVTCRLRRSHRMSPADPAGADILRAATALNAGAPVLDGDSARARAADVRFTALERLATAELGALLDRWHREVLAGDTTLAAALDHPIAVNDKRLSSHDPDGDALVVKALLANHAFARILCVTRTAGRVTSADAVNRHLHGRVQEAALARGAGVWPGTASFASSFRSPVLSSFLFSFLPGEPVLMLRNDYGRGLYNGDSGVVIRVRGDRDHGLGDHLGVAFAQPDGIIVHALDELVGDIALAFALTVHKAQGSEYGAVALVLPEVDVPLLSREVLYTALTRARHSVVVVGDSALFALAAGRTLDRASGIAAGMLRTKYAPETTP